MNGRTLQEKLVEMARENSAATWEQVMGVVNAIMAVYMVRGLDYDAEQAVQTMERFNRSGVLTF